MTVRLSSQNADDRVAGEYVLRPRISEDSSADRLEAVSRHPNPSYHELMEGLWLMDRQSIQEHATHNPLQALVDAIARCVTPPKAPESWTPNDVPRGTDEIKPKASPKASPKPQASARTEQPLLARSREVPSRPLQPPPLLPADAEKCAFHIEPDGSCLELPGLKDLLELKSRTHETAFALQKADDNGGRSIVKLVRRPDGRIDAKPLMTHRALADWIVGTLDSVIYTTPDRRQVVQHHPPLMEGLPEGHLPLRLPDGTASVERLVHGSVRPYALVRLQSGSECWYSYQTIHGGFLDTSDPRVDPDLRAALGLA